MTPISSSHSISSPVDGLHHFGCGRWGHGSIFVGGCGHVFCESHASLVVGVVGRGLWVWFRRLLLSRDSLEEAVFPETGENIYSVPSHTHTHIHTEVY